MGGLSQASPGSRRLESGWTGPLTIEKEPILVHRRFDRILTALEQCDQVPPAPAILPPHDGLDPQTVNQNSRFLPLIAFDRYFVAEMTSD